MQAQISVVDLIDNYFTAYNSARLREICQLLSKDVLQEGVTVGVSLSGAMTPAGFGVSVLAPLIRSGFIDWAISTGANLYHDLHYGLGFENFGFDINSSSVRVCKNAIISAISEALKSRPILRYSILGSIVELIFPP